MGAGRGRRIQFWKLRMVQFVICTGQFLKKGEIREVCKMKSFSRLTKEELYKLDNQEHCCDIAEHAGFILFGANISRTSIRYVTENPDVMGRYVNISRKVGIEPVVKQMTDGTVRYTAEIADAVQILQLLADLGLIDAQTGLVRHRIHDEMLEKECCRRAFVKGAFMSAGTVIDPRKNYNLEIVTPYFRLSQDLQMLIERIGFPFKSVVRKSKYVLYIKNSDTISDFLSYLGAFKSQMELLNIKIEKEIRNDFNRTANSETANIVKTINASVEQIKAIEQVDKIFGLDSLQDDLREVALLRLKHKDLSLTELGKLTHPPLSKSGVNHRLKKIMEMAK